MKTIITYGTYDLFHVGHVRLLKRLRSFGDRLVVGLSTDSFNKLKGKETVFPYEQRREILLSIKYVDDVFPESSWQQKPEDVERENASVFAMGDDWAGKFDDLKKIVDVIYLPRTENISTTAVKLALSSLQKEKFLAIEHSLDHVMSMVKDIT